MLQKTYLDSKIALVEYTVIVFSHIIFCLLLLKVNNLFAAWCFIESISLTAYFLVSFNSKQSVFYSFLYFLFSSIAGVLILWGISLLSTIINTDFFLTYLFTNSIQLINSDLNVIAMNCIFIGFFIKLGLIPFHF